MLSADDVKKFIELKRYELDKEKRTLSAVQFTSPVSKETESLRGGSVNGKYSSDSPRDSERTVSRNEQKDYSEELKINVYSEDSDQSALGYEQPTSSDRVARSRRKVEEVKCSARKGSDQEEEATADINRLLKKCPTSAPMGMLRAGEFSPNHPDIALSSRPLEGGQRDVFVGLGLYEERRKELLQRRQKEYREYLAQQRTMNALAKQQLHLATMGVADNFHHPHHQVNQDHLKSFLSPAGGWQGEWRGQHPVEQANPAKQQPPDTPEDMFHHPHHQVNQDHLKSFLSPAGGWQGEWGGRHAVGGRRPSSVAVQTDPENMMAMDRHLTQAERELSPRPIPNSPPIRSRYLPDREQIPRVQQTQLVQTRSQGYQANPQPQQQDWRMLVEKVNIGTQNNLIVPSNAPKYLPSTNQDNNYTKGYFDQAMDGVGKNIFRKDSPRARLLQDLRHTYMPSLFDEDAIKQRNEEMEQDAASKRAAYQLDLKKQIDEQHRIKEERKRREKMLEEAETRRLEEHLKMLKLSQETEMDKQQQLAVRIRKDSNEFERRRLKLQTEIENEKKAMRMARNQPKPPPESPTRTTRSNPVTRTIAPNNEMENRSNLPFYYTSPRLENSEVEPEILSYNIRRNNPHLGQDPPPKRVPYSTNIPDNSIFAESIPVKNYNIDDLTTDSHSNQRNNNISEIKDKKRHNIEVEHRRIKEDVDNFNRNRTNRNKNDRPSYEPAFLSKNITEMIDTKNLTKSRNYNANFDDSLPIPVLREPEKNIKIQNEFITEEQNHTSDAMRNVEEKWKVPAVQKNILKNNFSPDGKQENILTQLGSIRRQLQLEQLKLDQSQMFPKQKMVK